MLKWFLNLFKRKKRMKANNGAKLIVQHILMCATKSRKKRRANWRRYASVTGLTWDEYKEIERSGVKIYNNK